MDTELLIKRYSGINLDIACGSHKQNGFVGMDIQPLPGVDIVHDLNVHPWPLPDNCVRLAMASHILEHIPKVIIDQGRTRFPLMEFMNEVWRVMQLDGQFMIACPHGYSPGYLQDPTHASPISEATFAYFTPVHPFYEFYRPSPWNIKNISWDPAGNIEVILVKCLPVNMESIQ
jgi:hypothetical protein